MASSTPTITEPDRKESRPAEKRKVKRQLNARLLVGTLIAVAVLGSAAYFCHAYQVKRTAGTFLTRADALESEQKWGEAASYLHRYLRLHPDDADVQIRLARAFGNSAAQDPRLTQRAIDLYFPAVSLASGEEQRELQGKLVDLLLDRVDFLRQSEQAAALVTVETEAKKLRDMNPDDPRALRAMALTHYRQYRGGTRTAKGEDGRFLGEEFEDALKQAPADVALASTLALIYRAEPLLLGKEERELTEDVRKKRADDVMDRTVQANPDDADAYLARYRYRTSIAADLAGAEEDLAEALALAPNGARAMLAAADHARLRAGQLLAGGGAGDAGRTAEEYLDDAEEHYNNIIAQDASPNDWGGARELVNAKENAYVGLGLVRQLRGRTSDAIKTWRKGLAAGNGNGIGLNLLLATAYLTAGELEAAEAAVIALSEAVDRQIGTSSRPQRLEWSRTINLLKARCRAAKGDRIAGQSQDASQTPEPARREYEAAVAHLKQALLGQTASKREAAQAYQAEMLLGRVSQSLGEWSEAVAAFERAVMLEPAKTEARVAAFDARATTLDGTRAIRHFDLAMELPYEARNQTIGEDQRSEAWFRLASARFQRATRLPKERRNWAPFDTAMQVLQSDERRASLERPWRLDLLRASHKVAIGEEQGGREQGIRDAIELLRAAEKQDEYAESEEFPQYLALRYESLGASADADRVMETLEIRAGKSVTTYALWARLYCARRQFDKAREIVTDGITSLPRSDLPRMQRILVRVNTIEAQLQRQELREQDRLQPGSESASVYERLVALLIEQRQYNEAQACLAEAREHGIESDRLTTLAITVSAGLGQLDRAEELARAAVAEEPAKASARLNLAQVLLANKKTREAETAIREAIRCEPANVRPYVALFAFYLGTGKTELARQTLQELERNVNLSREELTPVLAESYERLGDIEKAEMSYREASRLDPDTTRGQIRLADFLVRTGKTDEAESILRLVVKKDPGAAAARHRLANILVGRGGQAEWQEALQLLEEAGADESDTQVDRRLQALLLLKRSGRKNIDRARTLLEGLVLNTRNPDDADRLLLAQIYEAEKSRLQGEGDLPGANRLLEAAVTQYAAVVERADPNPSHLALFVKFLIRNDKTDAASRYLALLERLAPENLATIGLRASWLHGRDETEKIKPFVEGHADKLREKVADNPRAEAQLALSIGKIYSSVQLRQEANRWYRRLLELEPAAYPPLVALLAQQNQMRQAIDVCVEAGKTDPSARPATVLASALIAGTPTETEHQQADAVLNDALQSHPGDVALLLAVANLRVAQKRMEEADKLYARVTEDLAPKNLLALNNRATLLSELPGRGAEALELIDRAIELAGEQAAFMDTKGMILVYDDKPQEAVPILQAAAYSANSDPRFHFHLAVAYARMGELDKARDALREAIRGNLMGQFLTEMDQQLLAELEGQLGDESFDGSGANR